MDKGAKTELDKILSMPPPPPRESKCDISRLVIPTDGEEGKTASHADTASLRSFVTALEEQGAPIEESESATPEPLSSYPTRSRLKKPIPFRDQRYDLTAKPAAPTAKPRPRPERPAPTPVQKPENRGTKPWHAYYGSSDSSQHALRTESAPYLKELQEWSENDVGYPDEIEVPSKSAEKRRKRRSDRDRE